MARELQAGQGNDDRDDRDDRAFGDVSETERYSRVSGLQVSEKNKDLHAVQ